MSDHFATLNLTQDEAQLLCEAHLVAVAIALGDPDGVQAAGRILSRSVRKQKDDALVSLTEKMQEVASKLLETV